MKNAQIFNDILKADNPAELKEILSKILSDGNMEVELIVVPDGSSVEQEMEKRAKREKAERKALAEDKAKTSEAMRQSTLVSLRHRMAIHLEVYETLKELEASINTPMAERDIVRTINEIKLTQRMDELYTRLAKGE